MWGLAVPSSTTEPVTGLISAAPRRSGGGSMLRTTIVVLSAWLMTRVALLLIGAYSFMLAGQPIPWIHLWIQWDANFYLSIASHGYQPPAVITGLETGQSNINFFPVLPFAVFLVSRCGLTIPHAGVLAANLFLMAAAVLLHRLALRRCGQAAADWSVLALFGLPGSFLLSGPFSEPAFLALSVASTLLFDRRQGWSGSICAALLAVTRPTGIALAMGFALNWAVDKVTGRPRSGRDLLALTLVPVPILLMMASMLHLTGDALAQLHSEQSFWQQRFDWPFQNLVAFAWAVQPRLQLGGLIALIMVSVLVLRPRVISIGEWLFVFLNVLSFSSSESAAPAIIRFMIGLYPIHLAFGSFCARNPFGKGLLLSLALANGALMVGWSHGSDVTI